MLVNCPRCGLSQPKDTYCAKCGVDMEAYKPEPISPVKKVLKNPLFHIVIISMIIGGVSLIVREKKKEELRTRAELLNAGPIVMQREIAQPESLTVTAANEKTLEGATGNHEVSTESAPSNSETSNFASETSSTTIPSAMHPQTPSESAHQGKVAGLNLIKARMVYAEVDKPLVAAWLKEMRSQPGFKSFDNVSLGTLPQISQKIRQSGVRILQQTDYSIRQPQSTFDWFLGTHKTPDTENEIGLFSSLNIIDNHDGLARGDIEIQRAFRDPNEAGGRLMERVSFGGPFELAKDTGFVLQGLLPVKYALDVEEDANPDPFLSIFKSRRFLNQQTEFIFILDFDSTSPQKQ